MKNNAQLKKEVQEKYSRIAKKKSSCGCCSDKDHTGDYSVVADDYTRLKGYNPEADLKLGCGIPTEYAGIKPGDTVVDLGSGAGNDCFVARALTGETGRVIGVDFSESMIKKAVKNNSVMGFNNVEFVYGDIENIPLTDNLADVVVSNCVMNLVPDKIRGFGEIFRILRPGGHFSISDIVTAGEIPDELRESAALYAGCVSGAMEINNYLTIIRNADFGNVTVQQQKPIHIPDNYLQEHVSQEVIEKFRKKNTGIFSITVYGEKPL